MTCIRKMSWKTQKLQIGERIIARREAIGLKQNALATKAGISSACLSRIENGFNNMSIDSLVRICGVLNVSADWLLWGDELGHGLVS